MHRLLLLYSAHRIEIAFVKLRCYKKSGVVTAQKKRRNQLQRQGPSWHDSKGASGGGVTALILFFLLLQCINWALPCCGKMKRVVEECPQSLHAPNQGCPQSNADIWAGAQK